MSIGFIEPETAPNEALRHEVETLRLRHEAGELKAAIMESGYALGGDWVDPREWRTDSFGRPQAMGGYVRGTRYRGANKPWWDSEQELLFTQAMARRIVDATPQGATVMGRLTDYVIGCGWDYSVVAQRREDRERVAVLIDLIQSEVIDEFLDRTEFRLQMERELFRRGHRDGEYFARVHEVGSGYSDFRLIEPEFVAEPFHDGIRDLEDWLLDAHPALATLAPQPWDWSYGILTPERDTAKPLGYFVDWQQGTADWDFVPANEMVHFKSNVDRNIKRGLSDYFATQNLLPEAFGLLRRIVRTAGVQAAIAYITEFEPGATAQGVETMRSQQAARQTRDPRAGLNTDVIDVAPGTAIDMPSGRKYHAGPLGQNQAVIYLEAYKAALQTAGVRWAMPEFMISGDASNANYASTVEAASPFRLAVESNQALHAVPIRRLLWRVIENAWPRIEADCHAASIYGMRQLKSLLSVKIDATIPDATNRLEESQRRKLLSDSGVMSKPTWAAEEGYDYEEEWSEGAEVTAAPAPAPFAGPIESLWEGYP